MVYLPFLSISLLNCFFSLSEFLTSSFSSVSLPPSSDLFWLGVSQPEQLTEEEQEVRNSDKEKKHLEGKSKEKVSEPTMH